MDSSMNPEDEEDEHKAKQQLAKEAATNPQEDDISDDEKDAKFIKSYMAKKRQQGLKNRRAGSKNAASSLGQEIYEAMIKRTLGEIRDLVDREQRQHLGTPST